MPTFEVALSGGTAVPAAVVERLMRSGVRVLQAWGMTETSPIATGTIEGPDWDALSFEDQVAFKATQGRPVYGSEVRIVSLDGEAREVPRDGTTAGALQVRGAWTVKRYFEAAEDAVDRDQWFDTGDVARIEPDGTLRLCDRTKDLIKSGGEWISSVELENAAVGHADVVEAAAIGIAHPRWDERPLLVAVRREGAELSERDLRDYLTTRVARWWLPDAIEFVAALPHTGTGKVSKKDLREAYRDYRFAE
jgi:fatty-acyl-CoA synthase